MNEYWVRKNKQLINMIKIRVTFSIKIDLIVSGQTVKRHWLGTPTYTASVPP